MIGAVRPCLADCHLSILKGDADLRVAKSGVARACFPLLFDWNLGRFGGRSVALSEAAVVSLRPAIGVLLQCLR